MHRVKHSQSNEVLRWVFSIKQCLEVFLNCQTLIEKLQWTQRKINNPMKWVFSNNWWPSRVHSINWSIELSVESVQILECSCWSMHFCSLIKLATLSWGNMVARTGGGGHEPVIVRKKDCYISDNWYNKEIL